MLFNSLDFTLRVINAGFPAERRVGREFAHLCEGFRIDVGAEKGDGSAAAPQLEKARFDSFCLEFIEQLHCVDRILESACKNIPAMLRNARLTLRNALFLNELGCQDGGIDAGLFLRCKAFPHGLYVG